MWNVFKAEGAGQTDVGPELRFRMNEQSQKL